MRFHLAQQSVGKDLHEIAQSRVTDVCLKSLGGVKVIGSYVLPECRNAWEVWCDGVLTLVFEPVDSAEGRESDSIADAANEESQDTLASLLCPLVGILDVHYGHELTDQLRIENLWVCGQVPHAQFHEHVLEARFDAHGAEHI